MYYFDADNFSIRLKALRKATGLTQEQTAEKLNICLEHLSQMERGKGKPSLDLLVEMACYFHVSTDYLLLGVAHDPNVVRMELRNIAAQINDLANNL